MRKKTIFYYILPSIIILAGYFSFFLYYERVLIFDWNFFNSFSHLLKSIILEYNRFPVHDPWVCGGVDILSKPQNWVFSPFIISTLVFSPYIANLFSLIVLSFIGCWGMYKLLKFYKVSDIVSIYCSLLFINSSWFGLHITEGHIAFRSFFLLPLVIYLLLTLTKIKRLVALSLIMCFFLVDGGIYAFIYSIVVIFFLAIFNMIPIRSLLLEISRNPITVLLTAVAFLLVSSVKLVPVLSNTIIKSRIPQYEMTLKEIAISLFYPFQTNMYLDIWDRNMERFHEFGSYIGILSLLIICWYARNKTFWKTNVKEILLLLIFFWLATGIGGEFNPETLLRKVPMINSTHYESRYFIVFMIFYIVVLARVIDRNIRSKWVLIFIMGLLILEFVYVRNYSSFTAFQSYYSKTEFPTYITKRKITETHRQVTKPDIYFLEDVASQFCYEAIIVPNNVLNKHHPMYKGEVWLQEKGGEIEVLEYSPGFINAKYQSITPNTVVFNTNSNNSWVVNEPHAILDNRKNLLAVSIDKGEGFIKLRYQPPYLRYIIIFYVAGILVYLYVIRRIYSKE